MKEQEMVEITNVTKLYGSDENATAVLKGVYP